MQVLDVTASHLFADEPVMKKVEYWRWRYHDAETGLVRPTPFQMLETEARTTYGEVERIEGSMTLRAGSANRLGAGWSSIGRQAVSRLTRRRRSRHAHPFGADSIEDAQSVRDSPNRIW